MNLNLDLSGSVQGAGGVGGLISVTHNAQSAVPTFFPTYDGNGNISEYLTASGTVSAHFEYDAFGRVITSTGNTADFDYRFSTKPQDFVTDWSYYGYRWYDAVGGRWASKDLIEEQGGLNLYGGFRNNSISYFDVLGNDLGTMFTGSGFGPTSNGGFGGNIGGSGFSTGSNPTPPGGGITDFGGPKAGGGQRSFGDGPKYGNWGGKGWCGGADGKSPAIDSSDECYKEHDLCYDKCEGKDNTCNKTNNQRGRGLTPKQQCGADCDAALKGCLNKLDENPKKWPNPPPPGKEDAANNFKAAALCFF